jgi:hypothetical protein
MKDNPKSEAKIESRSRNQSKGQKYQDDMKKIRAKVRSIKTT